MLMEEMGVNVELTRTTESVVSVEQVKRVMETVLGNEGKGKEMKMKATEIAEMMKKVKRED